MSKEADLIQIYNDEKQMFEYFVKGFNVTESVRALLKAHKESYDTERLISTECKAYFNVEKEFKEQIADLEAKLAEKEKSFELIKELRKNDAEVLLNYKTEKYGLDKTIQELRKIKLSFPEKEYYYKGFENCERQMSSHIADLTLEVKELKQQLAEKDKDLIIKCRTIEVLVKKNEKNDQDKISFCIEQLEHTKKRIYNLRYYENKCLNKKDCIEDCLEELNHQIEELKKEMK